MTWTKFCDTYPMHRKILAAERPSTVTTCPQCGHDPLLVAEQVMEQVLEQPAINPEQPLEQPLLSPLVNQPREGAAGLFSRLVTSANHQATDGWFGLDDAVLMVLDRRRERAKLLTLLEVGLVEKHSDLFRIHDFEDYQGVRETREKRRSDDRQRKQDARAASPPDNDGDAGAGPVRTDGLVGQVDRTDHAVSRLGSVRFGSDGNKGSSTNVTLRQSYRFDDPVAFPDAWERLSDAHAEQAAALGQCGDPHAQFEFFRDHAVQTKRPLRLWGQGFETWMRKHAKKRCTEKCRSGTGPVRRFNGGALEQVRRLEAAVAAEQAGGDHESAA